ncbi:MAG: SMC family ATPase [Rhodomicrobiaceae bacterium]
MQITGLTVEGVGRFGTRTSVFGFGPGVNVLAAPNEAGKSTLFRALRACIFERHTVKGKAIEPLITDGASLPVIVTVEFSHQGHAYRVRKSFNRSPSASLVMDGREIAKNREADEKLWEILGIEPGGGRSVDEAAFAMLWVGQGQSFTPPSLTDAGETVLVSAIEAEVGTVAGSESARAILEETRAELMRYVTEKTGKPAAGGPLVRALDERERRRAELHAAGERLQTLEAQFEELERLRSERERLSEPELAAQQEQELKKAQAELQLAIDQAAKLKAQDSEERRCHALMQSAAAQLQGIRELAARIDDQRRRETELAAKLVPLDVEEKALRGQAERLSGRLAEIEREDEAAAAQDRTLRQLAAASQSGRSKAEQERQARILADIVERQTTLSGEIASVKVTAEHVRDLEAVEHDLAVLDARLAASAAQLSVSVRPGSGVPVTIGGKPAGATETIAVTGPITVSVGDIATITMTPPLAIADDHDKARAARLKSQAKLLRACCAASLQDAREALARRGRLEAQLQGIGAELTALGTDMKAPEKALIGLRKEIAKAEAEIAGALRHAGTDTLPDIAALETQRKALASEQEERRGRRKALEAERREAVQLLAEISAAKASAFGELGELRRALAANLASLPDERRDAQMAEARARHQEAEKAQQQAAGALAELQNKSPAADEIDRLNNKAARLKQAIENWKSRLGQLDRTISNLEGQIQSAGGDGIGEQVAALQQQLTQAEEEVARHEARVEVLRLLARTIADILSESRDRFYTPILCHLKPFLSDLLPGAALDLGDRFSVAGLKRTLDDVERFDRLSDGTREQIAVIVRLAMGALLAEQGRPVPIILDDALVFSDDDRIGRMFDALMRAGSNQQVIVLTCRMRTFAELGGRPLSIDYDAAMAAE